MVAITFIVVSDASYNSIEWIKGINDSDFKSRTDTCIQWAHRLVSYLSIFIPCSVWMIIPNRSYTYATHLTFFVPLSELEKNKDS